MCGIAGFCNFTDNYMEKRDFWQQILIDMRQSIAHRGEDNTGEYLTPNIGLSHTRLSIRDLAMGAQPMTRRQENAEFSIVYNGEIYNAEEITLDLSQRGYHFETTTDTEVILCAYMEYGPACADMFNGIFAFGIWDGRNQQLFLCRDRLGVKPLFFAIQENTLVFGSEQKALFRHPQISPIIDENSMREIFALGPARIPGSGVFKDVHEIKPGHYAIYSPKGFFESCYWDLKAGEHKDSYEETVEKTSFLVRDAIERQMVSDVPVCSFLSGGIDSSIVTAVASLHLARENKLMNTFSFDFTGNDTFFQSNRFQPERDTAFVKEMLNAYPLTHTFLECEESILADLLSNAVQAKDLPGMADIDSSLLYFCSLVSQSNKVALTGECADEIFGGYPWFYRDELLNANTFPWSKDFEARTLLLRKDVIQKLSLQDAIEQQYTQTLNAVPLVGNESAAERRHREITYLNIKWFMQTLLDRMDRASMYSGLEARVPFADHRIAEYLYNVPWEMKYHNQVEKSLLRDAFQDLLPERILHRKKSPYPKTYNPNYTRLLAEKLRHIIEQQNSPLLAFIDKEKTLAFIDAPAETGKPWFGQLMAGPQMMAYLIQVNEWLETYPQLSI